MFLSIYILKQLCHYILLCCLAVGTEDGEPSHQERDVFAESENVNDIQEDMLNDVYDKATEVSLISFKHSLFVIMQ